ncbi:MAG: YhcH/YjgK/YiaL family protein [Phocaeicola sp.]
MIVDTLDNLERYAQINPLFAKAIDFLRNTELIAQEIGKVELQGNELVVNFAQTAPKSKEEAKLETHNEFIDIQIPLTGVEWMGYSPRTSLCNEVYNAENDITFYPELPDTFIPIKPGMFTIFFPQDAHAPGISPDGVKKVIVKIKA